MFLDKFKKAMDMFFKIDSSLGMNRKSVVGKPRRQRRRRRGGRF
jgi:hypothetical protein